MKVWKMSKMVSSNLGNTAVPSNLRPTVSRDSADCLSFATRLRVDSGVTCVKTDPPKECFTQGRYLGVALSGGWLDPTPAHSHVTSTLPGRYQP